MLPNLGQAERPRPRVRRRGGVDVTVERAHRILNARPSEGSYTLDEAGQLLHFLQALARQVVIPVILRYEQKCQDKHDK